MSNPRANGSLYTGLHSQSFRAQRDRRQKRQEEDSAKKAELIPDAGLVFAEIEKLKDEVRAEVLNVINLDMSKKDVKSIIYGLRLTNQKLSSLSTRLSNVLRVPEVKLDDGLEDDDADV